MTVDVGDPTDRNRAALRSPLLERSTLLRTLFNSDWTIQPKVNPFLEVFGGAPEPERVTLPHDWLISQPRSADASGGAASGYYPDGKVEYVKEFQAPPEFRDGRVEIAFDGVYRDAVVTINGSFAGQQKSGYAPFRLRIDQLLQEGTNNVRVEASNHRDERWYTGVGIYRDVHLLAGGPVHIAPDGVVVRTVEADADLAVVDVSTDLESVAHDLKSLIVATDLIDADGRVIASDRARTSVRPGAGKRVRQRFTVAQPALWSSTSPHLHRVRIRLEVGQELLEETTTPFGIRTLSWDSTRGLRLNGESLVLRGGAIHHDNGLIGSATITRAEERRVQKLLAAGYNAIRSAHNPISEALLDVCDRLGMLVMDEAFDVWSSSKADHGYGRDFPTWWRADLAAMIRRDRNHPSVIMYSIGNEIEELGNPWDVSLGAEMVDLIKELDDTRPVTNAVNPILSLMPQFASAVSEEVRGGINTIMNDMTEAATRFVSSDAATAGIDESLSQLDITGLNYAYGRYSVDLANHPQRLIVGTESNPGSLDELWPLVESDVRIVGDFSWTAWEYLGEAGLGRIKFDEEQSTQLLGDYPWRIADTGDFTITGRRRTVSEWRETVWGLRDQPAIAVERPWRRDAVAVPGQWSWSDTTQSWSWTGWEDRPITVDVYSNSDEVELLLDGVLLDRQPVGAERPFIARFETRFHPGTLTAVAYRDGSETGRCSLVSANADSVELRLSADYERVTTHPGELVHIDISLTDQAGVVHTLRDRSVTVTLTGNAHLQGLGSDDPASENSYADDTCETFEGRAMAVIRPTGPGPVTVHVAAGDISGSVHLEIEPDPTAHG